MLCLSLDIEYQIKQPFHNCNTYYILCLTKTEALLATSHSHSAFSVIQASAMRLSDYAQILVWAAGCSTFIALTIRDFLPLYFDYTGKNVIAQIDIRDDPIPRPDIAVCLPWYSNALANIATSLRSKELNSCIACKAMQKYGWDVWKMLKVEDLPADLFLVQGKIAEAIISKLMIEAKTGSIDGYILLNHSNFNWNQPIVDSIRLFLCAMADEDVLSIAQLTSPRTLCGAALNLSNIRMPNDTVLNRLSDSFLQAFSTYARFSAGTGDDFANMVRISDPLESRSYTISSNHVCFTTLPNSTLESYEYVAFDDEDDPPWIIYGRTGANAFYVSKDSALVFSSMLASAFIYQTEASATRKITYAYREIVVGSYSVTTKVSEGRNDKNCSKEGNVALCVAKRRVKQAIEKCNCIPFSYRALLDPPKALPYCNATIYSSCEFFELPSSEVEEECKNRCEYWFYSFTSSGTYETRNSSGDSSKTIGFFIMFASVQANMPFVEFTLVIRDSVEKFISQIGGIAGLYLGTSGITICSFIVFCINAVQKRRLRGKVETLEIPMDREDTVKRLEESIMRLSQVVSERNEATDKRMERIERKLDILRDKRFKFY